MAKAIIHPDGNGGVVIVRPVPEFLNTLPSEWSEEEKLLHIANKDLETGQKFEIINLEDLPDKRFYHCWDYVAGENEKESAELDVESKVEYRQQLTQAEAQEYEAIRTEKVAALKAKAAEGKELENADIN